MSSFHDLNVPIVSFVGRPADWRKGLQMFLDALELVSHLDPPVRFSTWIVGGSEAEAPALARYVSSRPRLSEAHVNGNILIWSRVENEALAEIYSRSAIVVMPSLREQFGLVAVEAMMSGTPVVALAIGGLPDVILDELTGVLVAENDSALLANTIAGYLRNPDRRRAHAAKATEWARFAFDRDQAFAAFEASYDRNSSNTSAFPTEAKFRRDAIARLQESLQKTLCLDATIVEDLTMSRHISVRVNAGGQTFFCKQYVLEPSPEATAYGLPVELNPRRLFREFADQIRFHADNQFAPRALLINDQSRLIVSEWCPPVDPQPDENSSMLSIADGFRRYRPLDAEGASRYEDALSRFAAAPSRETLLITDLAAADLNAQTIGGVVRFQQTHPQIEIWRIGDMIRRGAWSLPAAVTTRTSAVIQFLLDRIPFVVETPALCHGALEPEHALTRGGMLVGCDLDSSRYVVGPFDEAYHVWHRMQRDEWTITVAMEALGQLLPSKLSRSLGICWFAVDLFFFEVLCSAVNGKAGANKRFLGATDALPSLVEALFGDDKPVPTADQLAVSAEAARHPV